MRPVFVEETVGRAIGPDVRFVNFADGTVPNEFAELARAFGSLALVAHLRGDFFLARGLGELAGFPDGMSERLFAIDMLAKLDGVHGGEGVMMIRSGDDDRVDVLLFIEHLAIIFILFRFRKFFEGAGAVRPIDIAKCDDVFAAHSIDIAGALAGDADGGDVQAFIGGLRAVQTEHIGRDDHERAGGDRAAGEK